MKRVICLLITVILILGTVILPVSATSAPYRSWLQSDPRWGSIPFGSTDTISKSGCAITSIAKLLVHSGAVTTDESAFNPGIYCEWLKNNGAITAQGWIVWSLAANYSSKFSYYGAVALAGTQSQKTATIKSFVDDGYVVVVSVKGGGHYVAVDKVSGGQVYIMDPANTGYDHLFDYPASGVDKIQIYKGPHNGSGSLDNTPVYDTTVDPVGAGSYIITSDNGINLRSGAGTDYDILTAIPYKTAVTVTQVKNGWGKTTYDGKTGWFTLEFAEMQGNSLRGLKLKEPDKLSYYIGEKLDTAGMTVTALYADGTSKKLTKDYTVSGFSSDKEGTVKVYVTYQTKSAVFSVTVDKKKISYEPGTYAVNDAAGVNLRSEPSTQGEILVAIPDKERLEITEISENWGKTQYGDFSGWVCLDYTAKTTATQTGIQVSAQTPCILTGSLVTKENFTVYLTYEDGSKQLASEVLVHLGVIENNILPVTVTVGEYSVTVELKLFDSIPQGDSNFDGNINAADALAVLQFAVGKPTGNFYEEVSDVNKDEVINAADALMILQVAVGKLPGFDAESPQPPADAPSQTETE